MFIIELNAFNLNLIINYCIQTNVSERRKLNDWIFLNILHFTLLYLIFFVFFIS